MDLNEEFEDESVGTYRCHDIAANLSIKITINNKGSADHRTEEAIVQWQHKLFSPPELERYSTLETAETKLQKRFKEEASRLRAAAQPPNNTIFTHIQTEDFVAEYERSRQLLKPAPRTSKMAETLMELRYRGPPPPSDESGTEPDPDQDPSDQPTLTSVEQRLRSLALTGTDSMFIMLYAQGEEHVLCRLDWSHSGVLTVRPDFSPGSQPYRLQVGEGQKGLYAYRLEWVSPGDDSRPAGLSTQPQAAAVRRPEAVPRAGPAPELPLPPVGSLLVALSGELVSARGFQRDNLFIHYFMELPKGWRASADTRLSGITQLSRAPPGGDAHFGFPVSAELVLGSPEGEEADWCQRWPTLYLEVLSEDALGVSRTEGYCHVTLPAVAGGLSRRLAAWRPTGDRRSQLRRHFIGGSPELEDPSFVAVPAGFQGDRLSRYGFRTETTGEVTVRLSALHQSQSWADGCGGGRPVDLHGPPGGVGAVLEAFRRARQRMLRARQQLEGSVAGAGRDHSVGRRVGETPSVSVG